MTPKRFRLISEFVENSFKGTKDLHVVLDKEKLILSAKAASIWTSFLYIIFLVIGPPLILFLLEETLGVRILAGLVSLIFSYRVIQFFNFEREITLDFKSKRIVSENKSVLKFLFKSRSVTFDEVKDFSVKTIFYQKWMPTTKGVYVNAQRGEDIPIASLSSSYLIGRLQHLIRLVAQE